MASTLETSKNTRQGSETSLASNTRTPKSRLELLKSVSTESTQTTKEEKNKGGLLGGIGYAGEKLGLGIVQGVEGIFDYVGAGILDLFGADDAAEDVLENDWLNYSHADEWFNPGEGWKVAGDVAGGIGTSIPGLAAGVVAGVATGGASLVPTIAGLATSGLSAAGTSTKEAFQESGELGLKEFGYGAIMGGVEAGTEFLSGKIGAGILKNADDIAAAFGKTASKTAKAVSAKTIAASLGKEFASEAFEEGFAEFVSPYAKRLTYDPNAKNATIEEISYAALVGGLSGIVMGGGTTTITQTTNLARGSKAVDAGRVTSIMDTAKAFSDYEGTSPTKLSSMEAIRDLYTRLDAQGVRESTKLTVNQRRAIGELQSLTTSAVFEPAMQKSAISAIEGADVIAQKLNADGQIKIVDGKMQAVTAESLAELQKQGIEVRDITADDIRGGVDVKDGKSVAKAMKENDLLRYIAASDVAGRFMMTAKEVETAARAGTKIRSQADLNNYIEKATPEMKAALGAELGIADNEWDTLKLQRFNEAAAAYRESGKLDAKRAEMKAKTAEALEKNPNAVKSIPMSEAQKAVYDGIDRHDITAQTEKASEEAKRKSMDAIGENAEATTVRTKVAEVKERIEAKKIDEYLRENVEGYASMGEANKSMIRQVVREGRASGISDADILSYAKVAEHTGLNVEFDASLKEGEAGYYDPKGNKIVVNPKTTKKQELILIHELDHALRKFVAGDEVHTIVYKNADKKLSQKTRDMIEQEYSDQDTDVSREELFADESSAYYSEAILGGKVTVDMLLGKETTLKQKILSFFAEAARAYSGDAALAKEARAHYRRFKKLFDSFAERNKGRNAMTATEARGKVNGSRFSLEFAPEIANNQREFLAAETRRRNIKKQQITLTEQELETAIAQTAEMVEAMSDKKDILPRDKVGKTLVKNGSYDVSVENTTICVRTLSYNSFVDMVSEKIGRPLSQMESFLVSQKLYDIAKEPQCLYCYVSLDRKAYNDMLLRYVEQRDAAIKAYVDAGKPKLTKESPLYKDFLKGRKSTDNMWDRYSGWIKQYNDGVHILTAEDIATEAKRSSLFNSKDASQSSQVKDMLKYAQSASWAKKQTDYVAYYDDILKLSDKVIKDLNKHYGLRWYSFSDYSGAFIVENMQQITDAAIRGLKGLAYTKDTDFARIFAPTGMNINISVYAMKDGKGGYVIDEKQSANLKEAIDLRKKYPNVGIVAVATDQQGVEWALAQEWSDVVIPFHTVRTGAQVAEFYDWTVFNEEQNDSVKDENLWNAYVDSVTNGNEKARKKVSKMVYPSEHQNNRETYLRIVQERGLKPRFSSFVENPNYMKLVNETRQSESATQPLKPTYDLAAAKESFGKFVDKGGYFEGWYNDGIDVDGEAELVAQDIREGKKANEVEYGRQDRNGNAIPTPEDIMASRKKSRSHGAMVDKSVRLATDYEASLKQLEEGTFDAKSNTHIKVLDHTPKIFIDKANAADREVIMSWDIALLAMKRREEADGMYRGISNEYDDALNEGNYHGLGVNAMNELPKSLENPLYIVRQPNGRICAVTEMLYRSKRPIFAVIELEAYKNITQNGKSEENTYNLIVTVSNGQPRYFKNNVFNGEIVYNKNNEDPAHFISRLQSLKQLTSKNDLAGSSDPSIPQSAEKSTPSAKKVSESARKSTEFEADLEAARGSIVMDLSSYKPKGRKETIEYGKAVGDDAYTRFQIQATNQQAGLEKELKRLGVKNGEALVQSARSASNAAATMIGDAQMRIGDGSYEVQGEGLEKIYHPILNGEAIESELKGLSKKEREARLEEYSSDFFAYLFHMHNADRMSLEQRSIEENNERIKTLEKKVKKRVEVEAKIKAKGEDSDIKTLRIEKAKLDREIKTLMEEVAEFVPAENKPVLGHAVDEDGNTVLTTAEGEAIPYTAEESKAIAEEILKLHPEFKEAAEKVWAYNKNLNQYRVDAGLISQESFDRMQELYPHYVPTYREGSRTGIAAMSGKYALKVKATVKSAKGGLRPLCRPDVIMARQTEETIKAGRVNQLARTYYDAAEPETQKGVNAIRVISRVDAKADETIDFDPTTIAPKNNRVTFYKNGEKIEMEVDKNVFDGFDAFNSQTDMGGIITGAFGKVMNLYKRLITSYSPIFTIRNAIRDLQDAGINTKYGKTFLRNYKRAMKEIRSNGKYWQMYRAAGGLSSSLFDFERGFGGSTNSWGLTKAEGTPWQKLGTTIENANVFIEQLPRLAEFISSMEAKNSIEQAILDAADVTTNFGRSGKMARWLNRNFIPFLNPSIQGFSKLVRNVTDRKTAKELVAFLLKAALLGFAPQIINQLFLGDDDEYEKLRDSDKENNYIIRIPGREEFIKIPKGRVVAAMSGIVNRTSNTLQGKEDAWEGYLDSVLQNITPVDSASRDILSPFRDVKANKTWYGTEIEGRQFENVPVEERTDEGTSWIAEVLAQLPTSKAAELSPKKIHYLIDQYTGIIGDVVLPATSKKAQKDMLSGAFVIDPVVSNDLSNRFYNQYDKAVQTKNSTKSTEEELEIASFRYKYLGKIKDTVSDMQKAKREIQASDLKATEKLKQTREIQAAINLLYEEALTDIDKLTELYNGTYYLGAADIYSTYVASGITDEQYASLRYAETIRSYYGAETALSQYNSAVYDKATLFNKAGLDYDTYYEYYFSTRGIESDVDKKGEVVTGSKKKKTLAAIKSLGVSQTERLLLTAAAGYSLTESEKKRLISYINKLAVTKDEKIAIAEACGFTVKNGRISLK